MSTITLATLISIIFIIVRFLENKFVTKEKKPIKSYLREGIICYLSVLGGKFMYDQITPIDSTQVIPKVFTCQPEF
tara:strand:+ start:436 stop:663 length:228 start_codon:yes stop_codon:yes gene_type:complete